MFSCSSPKSDMWILWSGRAVSPWGFFFGYGFEEKLYAWLGQEIGECWASSRCKGLPFLPNDQAHWEAFFNCYG